MKFFDFKRKPRDSDVDMRDEELLIKLTDERNSANEQARAIDVEIVAIQGSTRTLIPFMMMPHNWLRMKLRWYYKWHLTPYARGVHWAVLTVSVAAMFIGVYYSVYIPNPDENIHKRRIAALRVPVQIGHYQPPGQVVITVFLAVVIPLLLLMVIT